MLWNKQNSRYEFITYSLNMLIRYTCVAALIIANYTIGSESTYGADSGCGTAAIVAINQADNDLYRWTRPTADSGSFTSALKVGSNWSKMRLIAADSASGDLFAIHNNGNLHLYKFTQDVYRGGDKIGHGWSNMTQLIAGGNGVLYAIHSDGSLYWYRWLGSSWAQGSGTPIGSGWGMFSQVFSGGNGVLYGIVRDTGQLRWYRHLSPLEPSAKFSGPREVGNGWNEMRATVGLGDGTIYAIDYSGNLFFYKHTDPLNGSVSWSNSGRRVQIGHGWSNYGPITASSDTCSSAPVNGDGANNQDVTLDDSELVSSSDCSSPVPNKVTLGAGKTTFYKLNGYIMGREDGPVGSVEVEFVACLGSNGEYGIAPEDYPIKITQHHSDLTETIEPPDKRTYEPSHKIDTLNPYFGHGIVLNSITRVESDLSPVELGLPAVKSGFYLDLNLLACGTKPVSSKDAALNLVKALTTVPFPVQYRYSVGEFLLNLFIPSPEQKFRCFSVGEIAKRFYFSPEGKAIVDSPGLQEASLFHRYGTLEATSTPPGVTDIEVEFHVAF